MNMRNTIPIDLTGGEKSKNRYDRLDIISIQEKQCMIGIEISNSG